MYLLQDIFTLNGDRKDRVNWDLPYNVIHCLQLNQLLECEYVDVPTLKIYNSCQTYNSLQNFLMNTSYLFMLQGVPIKILKYD